MGYASAIAHPAHLLFVFPNLSAGLPDNPAEPVGGNSLYLPIFNFVYGANLVMLYGGYYYGMKTMTVIGIDPGTTNSACGYWMEEGVKLIPNGLGDHSKTTVAPFKRVMGTDHKSCLEPSSFLLPSYPRWYCARSRKMLRPFDSAAQEVRGGTLIRGVDLPLASPTRQRQEASRNNGINYGGLFFLLLVVAKVLRYLSESAAG